MSIALFIVVGMYSKWSLFLFNVKSDEDCSGFTLFYHVLGMITISSLSIASIALFAKNIIIFSDLPMDGELGSLIKQVGCSEGPLQVALEKSFDGLIYERMLNRLALSFIIIAYGIHLFVSLCCTDFTYMLEFCFCSCRSKARRNLEA